MLESIKCLLDAFEKNNIIYCHWKSNEHLLPALNGDTDLDMLFLPEQRSILDIVLNECGLKRFRSTSYSQYNAIEDFIGIDAKENKIWHLHLHYRLTFGEKHLKGYTLTSFSKDMLDNRVLDTSGCYIAAPEYELLMLIIRMSSKLRVYDIFGNLSDDDIVEYNWLLARINKERFYSVLSTLFTKNTIELIYSLVYRNIKKKRELFKIYRFLRGELEQYTYYSDLSSSMCSYFRTVYSLIEGINRHFHLNSATPRRRVSPSGGCVVAFLGSDGAGKSTTIAFIRDEFGKKLDVMTSYLGSGDGECSLIRLPMRYVARKIGGRGLGASVEEEYEAKKVSKNISMKAKLYTIAKVIWAVTLAYEKKSKLNKIIEARNKGMLILIDRYPQTEYNGFGDGPLLSKYCYSDNWFLRKLAEKEYEIYLSFAKNPPDLFLKLVVPTEIAINRKPEMTVKEINEKREAILNIFKEYKCEIVDTSVEKRESFAQVMNAIWRII